MSKQEWAIEISALLIVVALWLAALLWTSPWWLLIAFLGSAIVLYVLCRIALKGMR